MAKKNCPGCGARGVSQLWKCKKCGGTFCPECAKGWIDKSCPYCGCSDYPTKL